jgi:hypothetical protein
MAFVLGAAGAVLGWIGRARDARPGLATAASAIGALAFLLGLAALVIDQVQIT